MADRTHATLRLDGPLTMQTVLLPMLEGRVRLAGSDLVADFSGVGEADSAALALLLDWTRIAAASGHGLAVRALPGGLRSLAQLYGIDELLPPDA